MKKYICIFVIAAICASMMFLVSCDSKEENADMEEINKIITNMYDISELIDYFDGNNANESVINGMSQNLSFNDVNQFFPIEVIRPNGYSVYSVKQGGYFYVFWSKAYISNSDVIKSDLFVYFTAYLPSTKDLSIFDSLKVGISTAEDVKMIDPSFELMFLRSSGIFSYSFLNDEDLLEIEYISEDEVDGYDDLIVKEIKVISRKDAPSRYSSILSMDLPG